MRLRPVDPCDTPFVVAAVCVFSVFYYDAGVEERAADGPEEGGEAAGLCVGLQVSQRILLLDMERSAGGVRVEGRRCGL